MVFGLPAMGSRKFPVCEAEGSTKNFQGETVTLLIFRACDENWCLDKVYESREIAGEIGLQGENAHLRARLVQKRGSWQVEAARRSRAFSADCLLPPKVTQAAGHIYLAG